MEGALAAANAASLPRFRVETLAAVGEAMHEAGQRDRAESVVAKALGIARGIGNQDERQLAISAASESYTPIGRCTAALDLAGETNNTGFAIRTVAANCTNPRQLDAILRRTSDIKYDDTRAQALSSLAVRYAKDAEWGRALSLAKSIDDPLQRALALSSMAMLPAPTRTISCRAKR